MTYQPHVLLAVSAHGYGHLSQVAPVINELRVKLPHIRLTVQGDFPKATVAKRINGEFDLHPEPADVGFAMHGPSEIDWPTTESWFQEFHADWEQHLSTETRLLRDLEPDLVIADVPYLPLAAANDIGIPAIAYSSLNWVDILEGNPPVAERLEQQIDQMRTAYGSARYFIQPQPHIPMEWLDQHGQVERCSVSPVATAPRQKRDELKQALQLDTNAKLVLIGLGGIPNSRKMNQWPELPNVHWLIDTEKPEGRADMHDVTSLDWRYQDLVGSADLIVTKPGYGTFTEAARCGVPVINIDRENWAETPYLIQWLEKLVAFKLITLEQAMSGDIANEVAELLTKGHQPGFENSGVNQAVELLSSVLDSNNAE